MQKVLEGLPDATSSHFWFTLATTGHVLILEWIPYRTGENIFDFSGTKWNIQSREPVIVHDILSNDILNISDRHSLQIKAMIHGIKDNGNLLDNTCELCLEDDAEVGRLGSKLQEYTEERKAPGTLPSNEVEICGTTEKPTDQGRGINDPEGQKSHSAQPEKE